MYFALELTSGWAALIITLSLAVITVLWRSIKAALRGFKRYALYEERLNILWKRAKLDAAEDKHSPDPAHATLDRLLERAASETLSRNEAIQLVERLQAIANRETGIEKQKTQNFVDMIRLDYELN